MSLQIIIRGKNNLGRTRSEQEKNIRKEWGPSLNDGQLEKCQFLERKAKESLGTDIRLDQVQIDSIEY